VRERISEWVTERVVEWVIVLSLIGYDERVNKIIKEEMIGVMLKR
jgi:hypothetical protein